MDFLKKHYEKVLLGIVLVGLAIGTAFLPIMIAGERESLEEMRGVLVNPSVKPLAEPDLTRQNNVFKRADASLKLDFSSTNKLFNPVPWVKASDGRVIKAEEGNIGPKAVTITKISPLYTVVSLDSVGPESDSGRRYVIGIQREAALVPSQRGKKQYYAVLNAKNDTFVIREFKGPPEEPTELILELNDTGESVSVAKDRPFKREDGYTADLKYEPEKKSWTNRRVGPQIISFGGEDYNVVAITKDEVVLSAKSNNKKTPISYNPNSAPDGSPRF